MPFNWLDFIFSSSHTVPSAKSKPKVGWLNILPPLTIELQKDELVPEKPTPLPPVVPPAEDPGWWTEGWRIQVVNQSENLLQDSRASGIDSVGLVMEALGLGLDFSRRALPDSILNHHLMLLRIEDNFAFEELKPYLKAMTRGRALLDKKSREADMYNEHLGSKIMVPD
ncbi:MAG: hypothetical protein GY780_14415 [bacterium]|nr:hypothetical protein [bacterium]